MVEFVDFKCELCGGQFWKETKKGKVKETVEQTMTENCPCCNEKGGVKRIPTPDEYIV